MFHISSKNTVNKELTKYLPEILLLFHHIEINDHQFNAVIKRKFSNISTF